MKTHYSRCFTILGFLLTLQNNSNAFLSHHTSIRRQKLGLALSSDRSLQDKTVKELWQILQDADKIVPGLKSRLRRKEDIIKYINDLTEAPEDEELDRKLSLDTSKDNKDIHSTQSNIEEDSKHLLKDDIDSSILSKIPLKLADKLVAQGVRSLLPIQKKAFLSIYNGNDVILQSPTGSGKTLAFVLPLLSKMYQESRPKSRQSKQAFPQSLLLLPNRELSRQVGKECSKYSLTAKKCVTVFGGIPIERHVASLRKNQPDVVVGTPGRVRELIREGHIDLSQLQTVVLDEADTLLDKDDSPDVTEILNEIWKTDVEEYQLVLVSATLNHHVEQFIAEMEFPKSALIRVPLPTKTAAAVSDHSATFAKQEKPVLSVRKTTHQPPAVQHWHISCKSSVRPLVTADMISILQPKLTIIFVATKTEAETVASIISSKVDRGLVRALHGDMSQTSRTRTMALIRDNTNNSPNQINVLVATDVLSRGIDLRVDLVVQFGIPRLSGKEGSFSVDLYTHRTGRTGRIRQDSQGNEPANAILLYDPAVGEGKLILPLVSEIQKELGVTVQPKQLPSAAEVVAAGYERTKGLLSFDDKEPQSTDLISYFRMVLETEAGVASATKEELLEYLARSMALLSKLDLNTSPFYQHASLLTGSDTHRTVRFVKRDGSAVSPPVVTKLCKDFGTGKLGRVQICQDGSAVFDLPLKRAKKLVEASQSADDNDWCLEMPLTLPDL